jgi:hypothetical protein
MKKKQTGWDVARSRAKAIYAKKMKLGKYWGNRWKTQPEMMRNNLNRLIKANREKANAKTERLAKFISQLPPRVKSWELRPTLANLHKQMTGEEVTKLVMHRNIMSLIRRGMITFDDTNCEWVIKPNDGKRYA